MSRIQLTPIALEAGVLIFPFLCDSLNYELPVGGVMLKENPHYMECVNSSWRTPRPFPCPEQRGWGFRE